jgi:hypothetical protein
MLGSQTMTGFQVFTVSEQGRPQRLRGAARNIALRDLTSMPSRRGPLLEQEVQLALQQEAQEEGTELLEFLIKWYDLASN